MKGKNKGKVEYVEEFRKISAIEKLPTLKQGFGDLFFQNKAQNSKFLRLKDEPFLSQIQLNFRTFDLCENEYVTSYMFDNQQPSKKKVYECMQILNEQIESYKDWSKELTSFVEKGNYSYVFKSQRASPPVSLAKQMHNFDPLAMEINNQALSKNKTSKNKLPEESVNMPNKLKRFDFNQITDYFITDDFKMQDLDGNIDFVKKEFEIFRQYKNIHQINQIEELKADYEKFEYHAIEIVQPNEKKQKFNDSDHLNSFAFKNNNSSFVVDEQNLANITGRKSDVFVLPEMLKPTRTLQQKFKYLSLHKNQLDMNINYFRSLGPPSRNVEAFIKNIVLEDDSSDNILQTEEQNPFTRQKIDTCLLHFLQPTELKIDKSSLNFYDIENISMSRMTSTNAHMCIRSQKVTRLQYEKLLKKMQKLYKMQHEDGKTRVHQAISTDQVDQDPSNNRLRSQNTQNRLSLQKLVEEINAIRKQAFALQNTQGQDISFKFITPNLVKDEMSKKMFSLLEDLYKRVAEQLPFNYSILQIGLHVDEINGLADNYFETKKLIWFIMTILQQIQRGKSVDKNITYLQNKNRKDDQPRVVKYKGEKVIAKDKMGTKNLFYNNPVAVTTARQKSVSMKTNNFNRTPIKNNITPNKTTHIKNNTPQRTAQKNTSRSPLKSTTYQQTQNRKPTSQVTPNKKQISTSPYKSITAKKTTRY